MNFRFGLLLVISAQICATLALPPCTCGRNLNPVCGSDGVDYSNECRLQCAAYNSGKTITVAKHGPCVGSLPRVVVAGACTCPSVHTPVCGSDGKVYSNVCELNCQKMQFNPALAIAHPGPCAAAPEPVAACPAIYLPVCGSDGKTYSNSCVLNAATQTNPGLSVAHSGPCENSPKDS